VSDAPPDYPPPPWTLCGDALVALQFVPIRQVRAAVPSPLHIVPVLPGRTLSVIALLRYGRGSTLQYHEAIVAPALVMTRARVGSWISHIYVDSEASMHGGRAIWNLPKQLAKFSWDADTRIRMDAAAMSIDVAIGGRSMTSIALPMLAPAFGTLPPAIHWFAAKGHGRLRKVQGKIRVIAPAAPWLNAEIARNYRVERLRGSIGPSHQVATQR
jgi:acetoacetate decarboxylase